MARKLILSSLLLLSIISCGYYEGVVQPTPQSYLAFIGNTRGSIAVIDDVITLNLDKELQEADGRGQIVLFQTTPGKHKVIVTRMGREVVNRVIIVANGATQEIQVP
ncbi:hypothetical protein KKE85_03120 [Patescibacteria group bacterium]|nr:hypothetical protein [Patescibacteria group bacterium]